MNKLCFFAAIIVLLASCQDVVELDLNNTDPRLVIDAAIELNEDGSTYTRVKLRRSAGFYDVGFESVNNAVITITDSNGIETPVPFTSNGVYESNFPFIYSTNPTDVHYTLNINDNGNIYTATESLIRTVPFTDVEQEVFSGFGSDITEITAFFNDPQGLGDCYLFEYNDIDNEQIDIREDEFSDGNRTQTTFFIEEPIQGTVATMRIKGINKRCFNFYETLLQQSADGGGGPFGTQPAVVRGNIINTTDLQKFPFGYFRVSEVFEIEYTIQ
jgi:hypothetical protein